jgi:hypothetical protein
MKSLHFLFILFFSFSYSQNDTIKTRTIQEVTIKGKKKQVEQTKSGIILNVLGTVLEQKDNVSEILKFAPNVSQIGGLKILGSDRIQIILNGKEVKINPEQFQTFLSSIDAKSIKNIEIVDKPDASLDSKYTSQIIINTKKIIGIDASLGMGTNYNFKFGQNSDASFSANFGKLSLYSSGNFFQSFSKFSGDNALKINDNSLIRNGVEYGDLKRLGYNGTINLNYDFNDKNSLSFLYDYTVDEDLDKNFNYDYKLQTLLISDSAISVRNYFENIDKTHTFSLQYVYKPGENGSKLTMNADYAIDNFNLPFHSLCYYYKNNYLLNTSDISQNTKLSYKIFTASTDYQKVINDKNNFSIGAKYSNSTNMNILNYYNTGNFVSENSQHFNFFENIFTGYFKYTYKPGKLSYGIGIRNEFTADKFHNDNNFSGNLNYNNFLPSLLISYGINKNNSLYFLLRKEIFRPNFFSYDPTVFLLLPNEKSSGNENLKPVKSYKVQSGYTLHQKYSIILQYTYSTDNIVSIPKARTDNYIFTKPENAGYQNQVLLNLSIPIKFTKFWESTNKFNFIFKDFRLPELNSFYKTYFATIESTQSFILPKDITLDIDLSYTSPNQNKFTYYYSNFNCGFSTVVPIFQKKGNIRFGVSDIFNTEKTKYYSDVNGIYQYEYMKFNTREFFLKFTYYFKTGKEMEGEIRDSDVREMLNRTGK